MDKAKSNKYEESVVEEYKKYYDWIINNIHTDITDIENKRFKYLYQSYMQLKKKIEDKLNVNIHNSSISTIDKEFQYREKFSDFLKKTKSEYNEISQCKNKDYIYYNNLSSWYAIKIEITISIIYTLNKKVLV